MESSYLVQQKFTFQGITGGTRYPGSSFGQFPISSSLHILPCFSVCYTVLKSCLYELDSCSRWMAYSHLYPFRCCGWTCLLSKTAEAWPRALWNQPFYLLIGLYTELTAYSSQLQKQHSPFPNLPCPKPGTEQIVIISFILLPVFFFQFSLSVCCLVFLPWDVCFRVNKVCFNFSKINHL